MRKRLKKKKYKQARIAFCLNLGWPRIMNNPKSIKELRKIVYTRIKYIKGRPIVYLPYSGSRIDYQHIMKDW